MRKIFPSLTRQWEILGIQVLLGCCAPSILHAGAYIPGYYGNVASILPPTATALPTNPTVVSGISGIETSGNDMTVHQDKPRAVIHWGSFDIGSEASVRFEQPDTSAKALNRVTGNTPSQIYGNLTANGQVYILNQNGILFGPGSQVNVHSLTASALNIKDEDFLTLPTFAQGGTETYSYNAPYADDATVANHGTITAGNLGSVFLIGPQVENNGTIVADSGHVGLFAGDRVTISQYESGEFNIQATAGATSGTATNFADGKIITDKGWTGMYGKVVNQEGLIRATTALEKNGRIELVGSKKVRTGATSVTETPITTSGERKIVDEVKTSKITIKAPDGSIEHYGTIRASAGTVIVEAKDRIYLETDSSIDVSGLWVELTAEDRTVVVQLNSEELRDAFVYKDGPLKGEKVQVDIVTGLEIADISGYLDSIARSAAELSSKGGSIRLRATGENGEVIVKQGALLDFSGGGIIYGDGLVAATKVRIGNKIYDLQDIPAGVPIDEVLGSYSHKHERYGVTDTWDGHYYGGSSPYLSFLSRFIQGSDAGSLVLNGRKIVLDGAMNAAVVRGIYQTLLSEDLDANGNLKTIGRRVPKAGTLQIGEVGGTGNLLQNRSADAVAITNEVVPVSTTFEDSLPDYDATLRVSELSATAVSTAGIGTLTLYPNQRITVAEDADLTLAELGKIDFATQQIDFRGSVRIPAGTVSMSLKAIETNSTTTVPNLDDRIYLASGSLIDVSGQRLDNSNAASSGEAPLFGFTQGGSVELIDDNGEDDGDVILAEGSSIDVSGGFLINSDHSLSGGDAGSIFLKGNTVLPGGTLTGLALAGYEGGTLSIHADEVTVVDADTVTYAYAEMDKGTETETDEVAPAGADEATVADASTVLYLLPSDFVPFTDEYSDDDQEKARLPEELRGHLVLADDRFTASGFTHIALKSAGDLLIKEGVHLAPSDARLAEPQWTATGYRLDGNGLESALPETFGASSLTLAAGQTISVDAPTGTVTIEEDTHLSVAPAEGTITIAGENVVLAGSLTALGGDISITANLGNLQLTPTASVDASGTLLPDWDNSITRLGLNWRTVAGGTVSLSASNNIVLEPGSTVDVSGSEAVTNRRLDQQGKIVAATTASAAGSVSLTYGGALRGGSDPQYNGSLGQLYGRSLFSWLPGGSLTIAKSTNTKLTVQEENVDYWLANGFDALTFSSRREIDFLESTRDNDEIVAISAGRGLSLNASTLVGTSGQDIRLAAPWVQLTNIVEETDGDFKSERIFGTIAQGTAQLAISGDFVDIRGNVALSGFDQAAVRTTHDLRLSDYYYSSSKGWSGALRTAGDLILQAAAIYPATHHAISEQDNTHTVYPTSFTISAGLTNSQGKIAAGKGRTLTIEAPAENTRQAIYSAGGRLTLQAGDIEHYGVLAAPMGELILTAENTIHLHPDSILSTRGEAMTLFGTLSDKQWTAGGYLGKDTENMGDVVAVTAAPDKAVSLSAGEITQEDGSVIDAGGGGSIFAYQFLPGFDGSVNPLGTANRYVILPDNSVTLPGKTIYLEGTAGLPAGTYSLLPVEYAFLPGALVIEATGTAMLPGETQTTKVGYTIIAGYESERAIADGSPLRTGYIIRTASDVLTEGNFDTSQSIAGDAGTITINAGAGSSVLAGSILGDALAGYSGGRLTLGAEELFVGLFSSLTEEAENYNLVFDVDNLRNRGLRQLTLGGSTTKAVTIGAGSAIQAVAQVDILASERVTLEQGARIEALATTDQPGTLALTTGTLYGAGDSLLRASDMLTLSVGSVSADTFAGSLAVDHGTFQLNSQNIYLEPNAYAGSRGSGAYLSSAMQASFGAIDTVVLNGTNDITFLGNVDLTAKGDLTLDSARITVQSASHATVNVHAGGTLRLQNDAGATSQNSATTGNSINLQAGTIAFGSGGVWFDTFAGIHFASSGETIFNGKGTLTADLAASDQLTFSASRYLAAVTQTATTNTDGSENLSLSDFTLDAKLGNLTMAGNGQIGSGTMAMPGALTFKGANISLQNVLFDMPGGEMTFQANGAITATNSEILTQGRQLNVPVTVGGTTYDNILSLAGGQVTMEAAGGTIDLANSFIDTSASSGQEGGTIVLTAADTTKGGVNLAATTLRGDRFGLDTKAIADFGALADTIAAGGFSRLVELRARTGDVTITQDDTVATDWFILTADQGTIDIAGTVDASGPDGGAIEIAANNAVNLRSTGRLLAGARDNESEGGTVYLASANNGVVTEAGSLIDVSGGAAGSGGTVAFRASRDAIGRNELRPDGEIRGTAEHEVVARAFRVYTDTNITSTDVTQYKNDINAAWPTLQARWGYDTIDLVPEIEVRSNGNLAISSGLDNLQSLTTQMPGGIPGVLTFRAAGNLSVTSNIIDAPLSSLTSSYTWTGGSYYAPEADGVRDSWDLNFIAGADTASARLLTVGDGIGNFTIGSSSSGRLIYTESGDIAFAAGNDVTIYAYTGGDNNNYMPGTATKFNLASFDGDISGYAGHNLVLQGGVIQTAISDITLQVENNVDILTYRRNSIDYYSAIRTTGRAPRFDELRSEELQALDPYLHDPGWSDYADYLALERFWDFRDGGDITLTAGGDIIGSTTSRDWDYAYNDFSTGSYHYGADYGVEGIYHSSSGPSHETASGVVTMAGGSIAIKAEDITAQIGAFKKGDVTVYAQGTLDGRFLAVDGDIHLTSLADFGNTAESTAKDTLIELGAGSLTIQALGNVALGTINNPTLTTLGNIWQLSYTPNSSVTINAVLGDVLFSGENEFVSDDSDLRHRLLPGSLNLLAARDIRLSSVSNFCLAPSAEGYLSLVAGRDVDGTAGASGNAYQMTNLYMSAADPALVYGNQGTSLNDTNYAASLLKFGNATSTPLHTDNPNPVTIAAGRDLAHLAISVPMRATITAERDIREISYWGQNLLDTDVSLISAGRDLIQQPYEGTNIEISQLGIHQAGHGFLLVRAGESIDLGSSAGIQSTGNVTRTGTGQVNTVLFDDSDKDEYGLYKGADIAVLAGYALTPDEQELAAFFTALAQDGKRFSELMSTGDEDDANEAARLKEKMLIEVIEPLLAGKQSGSGDIRMTQSVIKTTSGQDDLYILAAGQIDVGTTIISDQKDTSLGLLTEGGGDINVFAEGDINVNESRVVTFFGGDIFMLGNHGDINAGRGSNTAVSATADSTIEVGGKRVDKFKAPAPGSGIRTATADPDGSGPLRAPGQGKATLIAWEGVIDAGEAGIAASNVTLAATKILNSENISFSEAGVGVPVTADAGPTIGALAGATTVSDTQTATQSIGQQVVEGGKQLAETVNKMAETLAVKMLVFRFEGFGDDSGSMSE